MSIERRSSVGQRDRSHRVKNAIVVGQLAMSLLAISTFLVMGFSSTGWGQDEATRARRARLNGPATGSRVGTASDRLSQTSTSGKYVSSAGTLPFPREPSGFNCATLLSMPIISHHACDGCHCDRFVRRPFGDALSDMLSAQVDRGSRETVVLYHYDFYPRGSERESELTPRGQWQLAKFISRFPISLWPIRVQATDFDPALDESRRQHVVEQLAAHGVETPDRMVELGRQKHGISGIDATQNAQNLLESAKSRGRSIQSGESPKFGR